MVELFRSEARVVATLLMSPSNASLTKVALTGDLQLISVGRRSRRSIFQEQDAPIQNWVETSSKPMSGSPSKIGSMPVFGRISGQITSLRRSTRSATSSCLTSDTLPSVRSSGPSVRFSSRTKPTRSSLTIFNPGQSADFRVCEKSQPVFWSSSPCLRRALRRVCSPSCRRFFVR